MPETWSCPNCRTINLGTWDKCGGCGALRIDLYPLQEEKIRERATSLVLTTGFEVEGRPILDYLGIVTAEVVMGTGPVVEFLGGLADLFGGRSGAFETKLEQARTASLEKLRGKAALLGADAIIGIDIDYMNIAANMLMVVANGTAVRLSEP